MKNHLLTMKLIQQKNGFYRIEVYNGSILIKEENNMLFETAVERMEEIKEERNAVTP